MSRRVSLILAWLLAVSAAGPARAADQAFQLNWTICRNLADVRAIHPHPTDPQVAWAITGKGLFKTADEGRTFQPVASATTEKLGQITAIACRPADENCLLVGTDANGLFISTDGAASFKPMSSKAEKLASQHVAHVDFSRIDPSWRTVMVTHALGAPGMSLTRDLGKTWEVFGEDRYLKSFAFCGPTIVAVGFTEYGLDSLPSQTADSLEGSRAALRRAFRAASMAMVAVSSSRPGTAFSSRWRLSSPIFHTRDISSALIL